jgi:dephospho-CoA kinase
MSQPYVVGVTGGIGSGKSTVCDEFARYGIAVIDADVVAREVVQPGSSGLAAVVEEFGASMLDADGNLDRAALRRLVFGEPGRRDTLEKILHPLIRARIRELLAQVTSPYCLLAIPLLVEKGNYDHVNRVLVIDCPVETQISRVMARDKLTQQEAEAIIRTQASREQRLSRADDTITNATDLDAIRAQVARLHSTYLLASDSQRAHLTPPQ